MLCPPLQGMQTRTGTLLQETRSTLSATQAHAPTREAVALLPLSLAKHTWCNTFGEHLPCLAEASSSTYCALLRILRGGIFASHLVSAPALMQSSKGILCRFHDCQNSDGHSGSMRAFRLIIPCR